MSRVMSRENELNAFLTDMREEIKQPVSDVNAMKSLVSKIVGFYGQKRLRALFPRYRNIKSYSRVLNVLCELLWRSYDATTSFKEMLDDFEGLDAVPAMTIHKSKGLRYHTIFFIGLEDRAWIRFAQQREEHTCAFFVAFSRAKKQVYFTFCASRPCKSPNRSVEESRQQVASLYSMLMRAGVQEIRVA